MSSGCWLFQGNPKIWGNLDAVLSEMETGNISNWSVSQYHGEINVGDDLLFWQTGKDGGLMAIGHVVSDLHKGLDPNNNPIQFVEWALDRKISPPISRYEFRQDLVLSQMQHMKFAQRTNYRVTSEQWDAVKRLIAAKRD